MTSTVDPATNEMRHVLFIHGAGGGAYEADLKLVASLSKSLGLGYEIHYPLMPNEEEPEHGQWKTRAEEELADLSGPIIFIGHSLGASFLIEFLTESHLNVPIAGIFLIAAPYWGGQGWRYDGWEELTLVEDPAARLPHDAPLFMYHAVDDEVVPFTHLDLYHQDLPQALTRSVEGRGHQMNNDLSEVAQDIKSLA